MSARIVWTKEVTEIAGLKDITYVARVGDTVVAKVYKGGDKWYPWSASMPGHRRIGNASTLGSIKSTIEREWQKYEETQGEVTLAELDARRKESEQR